MSDNRFADKWNPFSLMQNQTHNYQSGNVDQAQNSMASLINSLANFSNNYTKMGESYFDRLDKYNSQYEKTMQELLDQKNKLTGNVFTDFINQYKEGRNSDFGRSMFNAGQSTGNWVGQQASNAGNFISRFGGK